MSSDRRGTPTALLWLLLLVAATQLVLTYAMVSQTGKVTSEIQAGFARVEPPGNFRVPGVTALGAPARGAASAKVILVEFGDFSCPACAAADPLLLDLLRHYPDRLRMAYRCYPLTKVHPNAEGQALVALAADGAREFWNAYRLFYAGVLTGQEVAPDVAAARLGLNWKSVRADPKVRARLERDVRDAKRYGVTATPTFFINGRRVVGVPRRGVLERLIQEELGDSTRAGSEVRSFSSN